MLFAFCILHMPLLKGDRAASGPSSQYRVIYCATVHVYTTCFPLCWLWSSRVCRETALLVDPSSDDLFSGLHIATVVAHEISHQWWVVE